MKTTFLGVVIALSLLLAPAAVLAHGMHQATPQILCNLNPQLLTENDTMTNDNGVSVTISAKVYEQRYLNLDTNTCEHNVFAEASWSTAGGSPYGTITANLQSCSGTEYQEKSRALSGITHGSIDTDQSSRTGSFRAITGTTWSNPDTSSCVSPF